MMVRSLAACAALIALAGCSGTAPPQGTAETCVPLYQEFDQLNRLYPASPSDDDSFVENSMVERQGMRLLRAGCIGTGEQILSVDTAPFVQVVESGAPIRRTSLHAGAVAGLFEEFRVREYFRQQGVRVRSVGHASLGRRIYLGPFETEGGLASAAEAARAIGFVAPYPARF